MSTLRRSLSTMRAAFFVGVWALVAFGFTVWFIRTLNPGYFFISIAVLFVASLVCRAPDEHRVEGATSQYGQLVMMFAGALIVAGVAMVLAW